MAVNAHQIAFCCVAPHVDNGSYVRNGALHNNGEENLMIHIKPGWVKALSTELYRAIAELGLGNTQVRIIVRSKGHRIKCYTLLDAAIDILHCGAISFHNFSLLIP